MLRNDLDAMVLRTRSGGRRGGGGRRTVRRLLAPIVVAAAVVGASTPASAGTPAITEFPTAAGGGPRTIVLGANGNGVWFTETTSGHLATMSEKGHYFRYSIPTSNSGPSGITIGPDAAEWFTESATNKIGRRFDARTTEYTLPAGSSPRGIAVGPDGALWFAEAGTHRIGRITTSGHITQHPLPAGGGAPVRITAGPDGALWFTDETASRIGRITTSGAVTEYPTPTPSSHPLGIAAGPDGNLWFTENSADKIGVATPSGHITEYQLPAGSQPRDITAGTDGTLWFTEGGTNQIGQITTTGALTQYPVPTANSSPFGITTGVRGRIWFTENAADKVAELYNTQPNRQYVSVTTSFIEQSPPKALPGTTVQWTFFGPVSQSVTDETGMHLFDSGPQSFVSTYAYTFTAAGDYPYRSATTGISATYKIRPFIDPTTGTTTTPFNIVWSSTDPAHGFRFDVQVEDPGSTTFTPWQTGTTSREGTFTPNAGPGTYRFEARLVDDNTSPSTSSEWSPQIAIAVK